MRGLTRIIITCLCALLLGCPNGDGPKPPATTGGATDGAATDGGATTDGAADGDATDAGDGGDPLEGSIFSKEQLFAIYKAELAGGAERTKVLTEHRLIDGQGQPVPARQSAYDRALQRYASKDPEGWAAFVESLPR